MAIISSSPTQKCHALMAINTQTGMTRKKLLNRIRFMIALFVSLLILSGLTAFPVYTEMN